MAVTDQQKLDFLLKKIGFTKTKTGSTVGTGAISGTPKQPFAEAIPSPLIIANGALWNESDQITTTPPGSDTDQIKVYSASSALRMTADATSSGQRAYIAYSTYGNTSSARLTNWIDTQFGALYLIKVYKGDPNSGGVALSAGATNENWFFDYSAGVLNFNDSNVPSGVTDTNIYIVGYRYIGQTGAPTSGISTFSFKDLTVERNLDVGPLGGISTFRNSINALDIIKGYKYLAAPYSGTTTTLTVTVASKVSGQHRYHGQGSGLGYVIDGLQSPFLTLTPGNTYRFDQSDGSNSSHQIKFYLEADKTTLYEEGVTYNGSAGNSGAYTQIVVSDKTPVVLHYQCVNHGYMGNAFQTNANVVNTNYEATIRSGLNVSGVSTFSSNIDANGDLDVDGHTNLDNVSIAGVTTFSDDVKFDGATEGLDITFDRSDNRLKFATDSKLSFGDSSSSHLEIRQTGNFAYIQKNGSSGWIDVSGDVKLNNDLRVINDLDVDGFTNLDGASIDGNLNVTGISTFSSNVIFPDGVSAKFGTDLDGEVKHTGSNLQIQETTGNIQITNYANDKDIVITTDDGSGGTANYFKADGSTGESILYNYGSEKLATKSDGIEVTGTTDTDQLNVTGISTFAGITTVTGHTLFTKQLSVSGISTLGSGGSGQAILQYQGSTKIQTQSWGIQLNGTLQVSDGDAIFTRTNSSSTSNTLRFRTTAGDRLTIQHLNDESYITAQVGNINLNAPTVSISTNFTVAGVTTFAGIIEGIAGENKIPSLYANLAALPSASTYHGMFAHVHSTGRGYFAHAGNWLELVNKDTSGNVGLSGDLDVDGHTNLDNLSVAGVSTFTGDATFSGNVSIGGTLTYEDVTNIDSVGLLTARSGVRVTGGVIEALAGENKIPSLYSNMGALPNPGTYHGMFAHVHSTGRGYFSHAGGWYELVNKETNGTVGTGTETYNIGSLTATGIDLNGDLDVDGHTNLDNVSVAGVSTFNGINNISGEVNIGDSATGSSSNRLRIGASADIQLYHDSTASNNHLIAQNGHLRIQNDNLRISALNNTKPFINADVDSAVKIYHAGNEKFRTTNTGAVVTGILTATDLDVDGHTNLDNVSVAGVSTFSDDIFIPDDKKIKFGNAAGNADLEIYHDGSHNIFNANNGFVKFNNNVFQVYNQGGNNVSFEIVPGSFTKLFHGTNERLLTTNHGVVVTGILTATSADINGDLDVDGHTNLDNVSIAGVTTTSGLLDINAGGQANTFKVEDLTSGRVVLAGTGGELEDSGNLTFNGSTLTVTGGQTVSGDIDVDGHTNLDNVSVAGVTTFSNTVKVGTGVTALTNGNVSIGGTLELFNTTGNAGNNPSEIKILGSNNGHLIISQHQNTGTYKVQNTGATGSLLLSAGGNGFGGIQFWNGNFSRLYFKANDQGSTSLFHNNTVRFETSGVGATVYGNLDVTADLDVDGHTNLDNVSVAGVTTFSDDVTFTTANGNNILFDKSDNALEFGDSVKATFGNSGDLQIFHDGSNSVILDNGTGGLQIKGENTISMGDTTGNRVYLQAIKNGAVSLRHNNVIKIETTNTGINVTGNIETDTLNTGNATFTGNIDANGDLDVDGHTNLDNVSIAGVTTFSNNIDVNGNGDISGNLVVAGVSTFGSSGQAVINDIGNITATAITISDGQPGLFFVDTGANPDFVIQNRNGIFAIRDTTSAANRFLVNMANGDVTVTGGIDVDGHTNLDNVSVAGVTTFASTAEFDGTAKFDSTITAGGSTGTNNQYLKSTGSGVAWASFPTARTSQAFTASAGQTTFSFSYTVGLVDVFVNGIKLSTSEFTATNGSTIVLGVGSFVGDIVEILSYNVATGSGGGGTLSNIVQDVTPQLGGNLDLNTKTINGTGGINITGVVTATNFIGDGSGLTGITASGSGIIIKHDGSTVGTAGTINFGTNLDVSPISAGIVTITASGGGGSATTINNNANNRIVTGSNTANTLEAESGLTFDGTTLAVTGSQTISNNLTVTGDIDANGDLDVDGHTNLDNVSVAGVSTFADNVDFSSGIDVTGDVIATGQIYGKDLILSDTTPVINLNDSTANPDYQINNTNGVFNIRDTTNGVNRIVVNTDGHVDIGVLDVGGNVDIDGDLDVDGHTNLDNVSIAGVVTATTFKGSLEATSASFSSHIDANGDLDVDGHTNLDNVSVAGVVTATTFVGALTGNVTGNVSGSSGSTTGNAATATALQNARTIGGVSFDGTANINLPGVNASGNQNTSGNAATATEATNVTVTANNSTNETVYPVFVDGATGTQGAETDTGLNYNPSTGNLSATKFTGDGSGLTGVTASGSGVLIKHDGNNVGTAGTINFGTNLDVSAISAGIVTITASGGGAAGLSTDAYGNTFGGHLAGNALTSGNEDNVLIGREAGEALNASNGDDNVFIGAHAGEAATSHRNSVLIGYKAGSTNQTGYRNVVIGEGSANSNGNTEYNTCTFVGYGAGSNVQTGYMEYNTFIGYGAGQSSGADYDVCIGRNANNRGSGRYGIFIGDMVGNPYGNYGDMSGQENIMIGRSAGGAYTSGGNNTLMGSQCGGTLTTGSNNLVLGHDADVSSATVSNEITLGDTNITKFRIPGIGVTFKDNGGTPTQGHVLTVDANGEASFAAASGGGGSSGISTVSGVVSIANDLDVDGHTNLDNVSVAGVSTFSGVIKAAATGDNAGIRIHSNSGISATNNELRFNTSQSTGFTFYTNGDGGTSNERFAIGGAGQIKLPAAGIAYGAPGQVLTSQGINSPATWTTISSSPDVGITTNLSGTFTASAGSPSTINTYGYGSGDIVVEYTVFIKNGSNFQSQKLLAMRDGTTIHSTQFAVMFSSSLLVQLDATISSGNILLRATPETGVSGSTTYKVKREVM